jgi:hypothetical protein
VHPLPPPLCLQITPQQEKKHNALSVVVIIVILFLFTCELHKDNNVLSVVIVLFAKLHCTQENKPQKIK